MQFLTNSTPSLCLFPFKGVTPDEFLLILLSSPCAVFDLSRSFVNGRQLSIEDLNLT